MKRILCILMIFMFVGCNLDTEKEVNETQKEKEKNEYISYVKKVKAVKESSSSLPFDVEVLFDKITKEEVRYQVIIDNPKEDITDVKAVAVHNMQTDDVFPSTGIFEKTMDLIPNEKPEGIILIGYIPYTGSIDKFKCEIKVLIEYKYQNKKYTGYYVTKK